MRTSRRFQPTLNGLPSRIAPSAVAGVAAAAAVAVLPIMGGGASSPITVTTADSDTAETGTMAPIILAPPTTGNSGTLVC